MLTIKCTFLLQKKAKGIDLLVKVCEHLNILEKDYFSLSFLDTNDIRVGDSLC